MAPPRRAEQIAKLCAKGRADEIAGDADPFVEYAPQQVEAAKLLDDAVADWFIVHLPLKGAKHLVPDDEDACIIAIKIARIGGVVDAVMAGRIHHCLKPARHAANRFGVNPELVDQVDPADKDYHHRIKADQYQWQIEDETQREHARPGLAQGGGKVVMLA